MGYQNIFTVIDRDVTGVEIRVTKAATLSGFVGIEGARSAELQPRLSRMRVGAMMIGPIMNALVQPDGSFTLNGLRPGKLQFSLSGAPGSEALPLRFVCVERDGIRLDQDIEIHAGEQINGIRLVLAYAKSSIHGILKLDNGPLPSGAAGRASAWQMGKVASFGDLDARGEFLLQHLSAGEYKVVVVVRNVNGKSQNLEKEVKIGDDSITELTLQIPTASDSTRPDVRRPR